MIVGFMFLPSKELSTIITLTFPIGLPLPDIPIFLFSSPCWIRIIVKRMGEEDKGRERTIRYVAYELERFHPNLAYELERFYPNFAYELGSAELISGHR